jgi:hypothetical protein
MIVGDMSFSDGTAADNRGGAVAEVLITDRIDTSGTGGACAGLTSSPAESFRTVSQASLVGVLADGKTYSFALPSQGSGADGFSDRPGDAFVGLVTPEASNIGGGFVVRVKLDSPTTVGEELTGEAWYRVSRTVNRQVNSLDVLQGDLLSSFRSRF